MIPEVASLMISEMQGVLGLASGALVGFSLGLVGGGDRSSRCR